MAEPHDDAHMSSAATSAPSSSSSQPSDPSLPSPAAYAAATADLQSPDAILEPSILSSLATYLAGSGGGPKPAKRAVRMLSEGYRGRGDMISLLSQWSCTAGVATAATIEADLLSSIQRAILAKFDGGLADRVLEQSQPLWLEGLVSNPAWESTLLRLAEKAPSSLFLKLCISLMGEQRREEEMGGGGGRGGGGKADGPSAAPTSVLNASLRASALHDFDKFNGLVSALIEGIIDSTVKRAAARKRRRAGGDAAGVMEDEPNAAAAAASSANSSGAAGASAGSDELVARIRLLDVDSMVQDFLRLSAQSEWTYLYAQRALQAAIVSAPRSASFLLQRISQDLTQQATFPPPPPASLLSAKIVQEAPGKNLSVYPFDLLLRGIKDDYADLFQVWSVLARSEQLSMIDINKLYARYAPSLPGVDPPPVVLLRHKLLIRTLLTSLFAPNSALMTSDAPSSSSSSRASGPVSDRHKYAYLLTYACCVVDERVCTVQLQRNLPSDAHSTAAGDNDAASSAAAAAVSLIGNSSAIDKASFDVTLTALLRFHELASNKGWGLRPYTLLRCIHAHLSLPLFACAAVYWIQTQLCDLSFYDMTYHSTVTPYFLSLLGELSSKHPLLRRQVFDTLTRTFHLSPPSLDGFAGIQFKKSLLNLMLHLLHCGFNFKDVVGMILKEIPRGLDHSLIRHFSVQLLFTTSPPYSRTFLEQTLQLLACPQTFKALQNTMVAGMQVSRLLAPDAATTTNSAAVQLLAQAHVAANTPAARRLLATAGMQDLIPDVTPTQGQEESKMSDTATAVASDVKSESPEEPSAKKSKHATPPPPTDAASAVAAGADSTASTSSPVVPGSKAARREEKDRARRAAAELEQRRKAETLKRLLVNTPRAPRPMSQITHDSHDGSERAVLDFCTLLHADPSLLRNSRVVAGLMLNDEGVVVADECDTDTDAAAHDQPIDETRMQQYMQTIQQYVSMQESRS